MATGRAPLEGVRILDLGHAMAAPFATQWLAYMGAQVVRIESRHHAVSMRGWPPYADGIPGPNRSGLHNLLNCNKLSCTLNLARPQARKLVKDLVPICDVVVENFSTGTLERMGLSYEELRPLRPDLIFVSVAAFGRTGPMKDGAAYHSAVALFSGMAAITGYPGGHPRIPGAALPDAISGAYVALALLQALYSRAVTGQGQHLEVAMTEGGMTVMPEAIIDYTLNGRSPQRVGNRHTSKAPHGIYPCLGDEKWIAVSVESDAQWEALCRVAGRTEWREDPRFANGLTRWHHQEELDETLAGWTRQHEAYHLMRQLQQAGVPAGPALSTTELLMDPHLQARGGVVTTDHPEVGNRPMVGLPWRISGLPPAEYRPAPLLGQHVPYVLGHLLGLSEEEVRRLQEEDIVA